MPRYEMWLANFSQEIPAWAQKNHIVKLVESSDYAASQLLRDSTIVSLVQEHIDFACFDFSTLFQQMVFADEAQLMQQLRQVKHRYQVALIDQVVNESLNQQQFLQAISQLAQCLVNQALDWQFQHLCQQLGTPKNASGDVMQMVVLAMGKFGGDELNFSSDIDLIFAYEASGEVVNVESGKLTTHEFFFRKLAQAFIRSLDSMTEDGFVYRVDMRLRPFGQTGPLAMTFSAMESYYQLHGRDWERYAMMKARPVAGNILGGKEILQNLRPFIYRRYLDYSALHAIAEMKHKINQKIHDEGMISHIKLGRGGIREAEFAVQATQLVYGGQYPRLQTPSFLQALQFFAELHLWESETVSQMSKDYLLLREVENALQFDQEHQTHSLPENLEGWQRLAVACGYSEVHKLKAELAACRDRVYEVFQNTFSSPDEVNEAVVAFSGDIDWQNVDEDVCLRCLESLGINNNYSPILKHFSQSLMWQRLPARTLTAMEKLLNSLMKQLQEKPISEKALSAILKLFSEVAGRSVYIDMLAQSPKLLAHLLHIANDSAWLIAFITEHPLVMDDVLGERENVDDASALANDLTARLEGLDEEQWLLALRDFKHAQLFKVAWADVHGSLSLMQVSDNLSLIAELIIKKVWQRAYWKLTSRYGVPRDKQGETAQFAVIGYGKLGGLEIGYGSDLDMVFVYDDGDAQGETDGEKSIANQMFFTRLAQRMINYLSSASTSGAIYEVDTRLRPGGKSGMIVSSLSGFSKYQQEKAWVWEHQALVRARAVVGDPQLCRKFEDLRKKILTKQPDDHLSEAVLSMREKMLEHQLPTDKTLFDIKHSRGGLIDIEFMVQYLLLMHAHREPVLIRMSDNIRQLAGLEAVGILTSIDAMTLRDAYRKLRRAAHACFLNQQDNVVTEIAWQEVRLSVFTIWQKFFGSIHSV